MKVKAGLLKRALEMENGERKFLFWLKRANLYYFAFSFYFPLYHPLLQLF